MRGLFITATGTGAGKTTLTAGLARALRSLGHDVVALKPIETGVESVALDARALAEACGKHVDVDPRWYRARAPLSPYAAHLESEPALDLDALVGAVREVAGDRLALVEGAGGLLVPLTRDATIADLARALALPLLVIAPDRLGVLSDVLAVMESAERRGLPVAAVVLDQVTAATDPSERTNARILSERLDCPVLRVPFGGRVPDALIELAARL